MEFRVLGPVELWSAERRVVISGSRQLSVLGMLLLEPGRPVSQDRLIDAVWGDSSPPSAEAMLHSCVYRIRKALAEVTDHAALRRGAYGYLLDAPDDAVDAHRFEQLAAAGWKALDAADHQEASIRLREALGLWRGAAFAGIGAPPVRERATGLSDLRLDATEWCLTAELKLGRHDALLGELEGLTSDHPYRERFWELLMTALYRSGRQADALDAYQRVYRLLDDDLGVQPGRVLRELQQQVLAGALERQVPLTVSRAQTEAAVPPQLLPAAVRGFTGRAEHLKALGALLPDAGRETDSAGPSAVVISVVSGTAGVGKTALAVHWAHQVAGRFADGQLYVNLNGFGPSGGPMSAEEAIRRFLDTLGVSAERIPVEVDAQAGLYRSLLAGKRMLVLLDNAADEEQVRPLLPASSGCLVLVTSRNQLPGLIAAEAAHPINLELLSDTESHELLAHRIGHDRLAAEPVATRELIDHCARLPLALAIVAARAATSPQFPLSSIAAQLHQTGDSLDAFTGTDSTTDLRSVFSWSLYQVSPDAAQLFRLLGLHPGPDITPPAAASLAGRPLKNVRSNLDELCRANLLTEHVPGRSTFHDLLRAYATDLINHTGTNDERHRAIQRLLDHYLHTACAANRQLHPTRAPLALTPPGAGVSPETFEDYDQSMAWFSMEHAVLLSCLRKATTAFDVHAWQLAWALTTYLQRQGYRYDRTAVSKAALDATTRLGDKPAQARTLGLVARAHIDLGHLEAARAYLRKALALEIELGDRKGQAYIHIDLCKVCEQQKQYADALNHAQQALTLQQSAGHRGAQANALNAVGWLSAHLGRHRQSLDACARALAIHQEVGNRYGEAETWDSLGYIHHHLGHHDDAMTCFRQAIKLFREEGDRYQEATTLTQLGETHHATGNTRAAHQRWREALVILEELDHPDAELVRAKLGR